MAGKRSLAIAIWAVFLIGVSACSTRVDAGAAVVSLFFTHLERHEFDAAADMVRDSAGSPMPDSTRQVYITGWRKAYERYQIHFTKVLVRPIGRASDEQVQAAGAREGYFYDVKFEGTSNSPCVPVSSDVIPGLTQPVAMLTPNGSWFLTTQSILGFVHTCPGASRAGMTAELGHIPIGCQTVLSSRNAAMS